MSKAFEGPSVDEFINLVLESLSERQKLVIVYRYGIGGTKPMTYKEIGKKLGVCKERARCIVMKAIYLMSKPWNKKILRLSIDLRDYNWEKPALCRDRPPEWAMNKYHGAPICDS